MTGTSGALASIASVGTYALSVSILRLLFHLAVHQLLRLFGLRRLIPIFSPHVTWYPSRTIFTFDFYRLGFSHLLFSSCIVEGLEVLERYDYYGQIVV